MESYLISLFIDPLREAFFQKALLGAGVVAVVCSVVGCLVVLRRMAFLGDALSHAMIAGVAGGYLFMKVLFGIEAHAPAMLLGSIIAALITVMLIGFVSRVSRVKEDAAIGIMYTGIFAVGVVVVSIFRNYIHIDLMHFIMGDVLAVADADLWASTITAALVLSVVVLFFRYFQITTFDPIMAASIGIPVVVFDYVLTTCVSLVVVSAVSMVGVILVIGLLITPAASAYLLSDRLERMMLLAAIFGITSVVGGLYLAMWLDSAGGGAIILFCTLQFVVVLIVAPRYGMLSRYLRLRRMVPQQVIEDILGTLAREPEKPMRVSEIEPFVTNKTNLQRAFRSLTVQGMLAMDDSQVKLTPSGRKEANRILRAHRLWETYLSHVGASSNEIHSQAHHLEHINDPHTVSYLDDLLIHPTTGPHGKEIPEDESAVVGKEPIYLSALRPGRWAEVIDRGQLPASIGPAMGQKVTVKERQDQGTLWVVETKAGDEYRLDHHQADVIRVRLD